MTMQDAASKLWKVGDADASIDLSDMTRAAVVLAVAAMDSYFTSIFVERLVRFIKKKGPSKSLISLLGEAGLDTECALRLLVSRRPFQKIRRMVESHLAKITTQKFEVIDKLFAVYNFKNFSHHVSQYSGKGDRLPKAIQRLVQRRHMIVHKGDLNMHGKLREARLTESKRRILSLLLFVSKADELLHKQLS